MDKRFIEESFPIKEVSDFSVKEKNVRKGHISTLHIWWARRPLASSRSTNYAALIPQPGDEIDWINKKNFIIELSEWKNSLNKDIINKAKKDILEANGQPPKILDPFSGGGAIPLEAMRIGCKAYSNDYNPVAVIIEKCTLEFPQKYGKNYEKWVEGDNPLGKDVNKWSKWVSKKTYNEIGKFYPSDKKDSLHMAYIWARTIKCQDPSCNMEIPLLRQYWLSTKSNKKVALYPIPKKDRIDFEIVGDGYNPIPKDFNPSKGVIKKAIVECPICGHTMDANTTRRLFNEGNCGQKIVAVVYSNPKNRTKNYRVVNDEDLELLEVVKNYLQKKRQLLYDEWGFDPVPDEPLPPTGTLGFRVQKYGILKWGDLYNSRQKLALITFIEMIKKAYFEMIDKGYEEGYAKCVCSYLSLILSRHSSYNASLCFWETTGERSFNVFGRSALPMVFDYAEQNPFGTSTGNWKMQTEITVGILSQLSNIQTDYLPQITHSSATSLPYPDEFFDGVFTDPPYYDNVPYSYLSDYFYVWLKRTIADFYPELFLTPLTPKKEEIVAYTHDKSWKEAKIFFEEMLGKSFREIYRVLKPNGITTIVYAHKTTEGWETVINSLLDSGLTVTASWPISTEMKTRLRAGKSAALASSIYIIARKFDKKEIGWFKNVKDEIIDYIPKKLDKLWEEGISGADFFIAAIGSAIEIFGKYEKIIDNEGNEIRANKLLSFVRDIVTDYTVRNILHNGIADELSPLTKFYLMWRWNYQEAQIPYDDARKIAQSAGIDLAYEWNKGFITKSGEFITINGPDKRDKKSLEDSIELIDILHLVCLLWKEGKKDEMKVILKESGYGEGEALYKVAQAISETLPKNSSEKQMIEGFLTGRERLMRDMREDDSQTKLV